MKSQKKLMFFFLFVCFTKPTTCDSLKYLWFKENLTQQSAFHIEVLKEGDAPGITSNSDCMHVHTWCKSGKVLYVLSY